MLNDLGTIKEAYLKEKRIAELNKKLKELDYIGIKIATGRATREEYADKIKLMEAYAHEINLLKKSNA